MERTIINDGIREVLYQIHGKEGILAGAAVIVIGIVFILFRRRGK